MTEDGQLDAAIEYHVVNSLGWPSLRPLQAAAVAPVRSGADSVLVAPTAGGKTEAALFPLLSSMVAKDWHGLSVIYVAPLRALLNNLHPRVSQYGEWLGRRVGLWHGDIPDSQRRAMLSEPPDILLTTPESIEAMLVSRRVDERRLFSGVRAVVIDELHSFAGSDRGWHLLGVLERIERLAGHTVQRVGLSATVGNPVEVGTWMQGSSAGRQPLRVVNESAVTAVVEPEVQLDYVGTVENAALVISRLYRGEKRLVFVESRRKAEVLTFELRALGVETFASHSSLSADVRRQSELAFAESRNCVIVATSTLELGVDIGDLDRVIQIDSPRTVASFLQRLGRTGRRAGTTRNMLFLATEQEALLLAAGVLLLWRRGFVEPITAPPHPRHLAAQQLLALALQEGAFGASRWREWWGDLALMDDGESILRHLIAESFLISDAGLLMLGPTAEREFGRRHFMDLLSSFTVERELRVLAGTKEIGLVSPLALSTQGRGGGEDFTHFKPLVLNGYGWRVENVDWARFAVTVHPDPIRGDVKWQSEAVPWSFELARAQRDVLLGSTPDVVMSQRATASLAAIRAERAAVVSATGLVWEQRENVTVLWTWAGMRANATLLEAASLPPSKIGNDLVILPPDVRVATVRAAAENMESAVPWIDPAAAEALKFSAALPGELAVTTLAERFTDRVGAMEVVRAPFQMRAGFP